MFPDTFSFTHTNESHWWKIKYIFPQVHPKLIRNYYFRYIWGDLVRYEGWNFLKSERSSSKPVPKSVQKWKPVYLGKHNFFNLSAEAELISDAVSKARKVIFQPFMRKYLASKFHYSTISVPKHGYQCTSIFRDILRLMHFFFQLKLDFLPVQLLTVLTYEFGKN